TKERISRALSLTNACMRSAGFAHPRIAVAGLNPHAGDGGNFGREEIDVIAPVVEAGQAGRHLCRGAISSRYRLPSRQERRVRRGTNDVPRPGPDRDEADGFRSRRDAAGRLSLSDLHAGAWNGV